MVFLLISTGLAIIGSAFGWMIHPALSIFFGAMFIANVYVFIKTRSKQHSKGNQKC